MGNDVYILNGLEILKSKMETEIQFVFYTRTRTGTHIQDERKKFVKIVSIFIFPALFLFTDL